MTTKKTSTELVKYLVECLAECGAYKFLDLDQQILKDPDLMLAAVAKEPFVFEYVDESLKGNREIAMKAVEQSGLTIQFVSEALKADKDFALAAVRQNRFSLRLAAKELWNDEELITLAFGKYQKPSPDSCDELKTLVEKLVVHEIDKMEQGDTKEEFANLVSAYCLSIVEYTTPKSKIGRRMFFTIVFQAEPINLVLNLVKNSKGSWVADKCYFKDEDNNEDIHDNGRIDELLSDLDLEDEDEDEEDEE